MQHVLPKLLALYRLLGLAEATFFVTRHRDHFKLRSAITNDHVFESFFLLRHGFNSCSCFVSQL